MTLLTPLTHEEGNNHPSSFRCRKYIFTLNNYTDTETQNIITTLNKYRAKWIFGFEVGECGTPHLQGYMEFRNPVYWRSLQQQGFMRAFSKKANGTLEQNFNYTSKDEEFLHGGFSLKKMNYKVVIENYYDWELNIIELIKQEADDRTINWYWEPDGCKGKTTFQKYIYTHFEGVVVLSGKSNDMKNGIIEYIKKNSVTPDIVLINIPRISSGYVSIEGMESIKDMFFFSGKYEGGMVCGAPPHVLVFANYSPNIDNLSKDRWNIVRI